MTWLFEPSRRPWTVLIGSGAVLLALFGLVAGVIGWPTTPDPCIAEGQCYCEAFIEADVLAGATGVRQPVNTWFNLYAFITAGIVAWFLMRDRATRTGQSAIQSTWWVGDLYVFAVLFLGLGSMWFHASLARGVSWIDGMSMYVYAGFLVSYTLDRILARKAVSAAARTWVFLIGYLLQVIVCTLVAVAGVSSVILIGVLVGLYLVAELFCLIFGHPITGGKALAYWLCGVASMGIATTFWRLSHTGAPLCFPDSWFQPHALIWHPFAGIMAVLLFFYWREERGGRGV